MEAYKILIQAKDKFSKQFSKATAGLKKVGGAAKSVGKVIGGLGLAVAAAAAAFIALGKNAFDALDDIGKTADRTGIAAEQLQALRLGAVESGASVEDLNKAIEKFAKNIGDVVVKGTGEATYALDKMGIQLRNNSGFLKTNDELLTEVVAGIAKLGQESEKASILQSLFGRAGIKMNQVFGDGAEGLAHWNKTAREMGIIIDGRAIKAVEGFNDRFAELKFMVSGLVNQTFAALAPGLDNMITRFKDWAVETANAQGGLEDIGKFLATKMIDAIAGTIEAVGTFGDGLEQTVLDIKHGFFELHISILEMLEDLPGIGDQTEAIAEVVAKFAWATGNSGKAAKMFAKEVRQIGRDMLSAETPIKEINDKLEETGVVATEAEQQLKSFGVGFDQIFNNGKDRFADMEKIGAKVASTLEKGLTDAFMNIGKGGEALRDLMDNILKQIVAELIRVYVVQRAIGAVGNFFSFPGEATGGPVTGGKTYLVGERGPELFTAPGNGNIVPNNMMGSGGGSTNINITYDIKAFDAQSATTAIAEQAPTIVGIVEQSFRQRGRRGPLGA